MLIEIRNKNPDTRQVNEVVDVLKSGGIVILPTDTIYAATCVLSNIKGIESLSKKLGKKLQKANYSILCRDFSHLSEYALPVSNPTFKLMKQVLPGPFTFILKASHAIPKLFRENKKTIGIRVPDNEILQAILDQLDQPLLAMSIHSDDDIIEYLTDPYDIHEQFSHLVDLVVDGGAGGNVASTIVDCTDNVPEIVRQGKGVIEL
jgi:tRNA threonylcarbamoyl adenosine modification protein (Sua5/YciO/YrdC/YwlC family)